MSLMPYALARPFLFGLDAETAHELTIKGLGLTSGTPLKWAYCNTRVADPITVAGLRFPNRVGLAAGLDKNAECIDALAAMGFGFVEVGTVTPKAQPGNPKPRMFRLPKADALINRMGFNNHGLEAFLRNVQQSKCRRPHGPAGTLGAGNDSNPATTPMLLGLNIGKNAATPIENALDDYLACLDGVYAHADYVTVNISSPNTKNLRSLQTDEALEALLAGISERRLVLAQRHNKYLPIFLKIAPDLDDEQIQTIGNTLKRHGLDEHGRPNNAWGVIATNTTISRDAVQGLPNAQEAGGLSGAPVLAASNRVIRALRTQLGDGFPIVGVGGVMSAADAVSKIEAGADVVQIYTGLIYKGPGLVRDAALAIKKLKR